MQEICPLLPPRPDKVIFNEQWHSFVEGFEMSSDDFYKKVEGELEDRKIPGLDLSRVTWSEGGAFSANREYLRLTREKWSFDICAAPFGTGFFFSYRFTETPFRINLPVVIFSLIIIAEAVHLMLSNIYQSPNFSISMAMVILAIICALVISHIGQPTFQNCEAALIQLPILGTIYRRLFWKETYYREDTRLMYLATVPAVVKKVVEDVTVAKGVSMRPAIRVYPTLEGVAANT